MLEKKVAIDAMKSLVNGVLPSYIPIGELCDLYCYGADERGYPLYTDWNHMNGTYVSKKADFVDKILLDTYVEPFHQHIDNIEFQ